VTLASGEKALNPMRVVPNGEGSEVLFTLFQLSEMSDLQFVEDVAMVERDLRSLKEVLEG
ncbi:MAG TPA: SRPBCC family protein, partial [Candidatus Krumholzibacteria bacterium]|nr:SRPBCC family protein [Candidatus Krumholzibacteria bacterium]